MAGKTCARWQAVLMLLLTILLLTTPTMGYAAIDLESQQEESAITNTGNNEDHVIEPLALTNGKIVFSPSITSKNNYVAVNGSLNYSAVVGASYEYYDELVDGRLSNPLLSSTNMSGISFKYESYNSYLGGPAWRARKGVFVIGSATYYLNANTKSYSTGTYNAKLGGGPGYLPSQYPCSARLTVR